MADRIREVGKNGFCLPEIPREQLIAIMEKQKETRLKRNQD